MLSAGRDDTLVPSAPDVTLVPSAPIPAAAVLSFSMRSYADLERCATPGGPDLCLSLSVRLMWMYLITSAGSAPPFCGW